jgi:hypothetical protein
MPNYSSIPNFGQYTEYITQGPLVGDIYGVVINRVPLEAIIAPPTMDGQPISDNLQSLQVVNADYAKIQAISTARDPSLSPAELTPVKAVIAADNHTDIVRYATDTTPTGRVITGKLIEVKQRPVWAMGLSVIKDAVYRYEVDKDLYQVVQAHTITDPSWTPPVAKALWKRFYEPTDAPWPWVQPTGAHDAYPIGAKVTFGGYTWQNTIAANVWVPGVTGWNNLTPPAITAWKQPVGAGDAYAVGAQVTHDGHLWKNVTPANVWEPGVYGWTDLGVYP